MTSTPLNVPVGTQFFSYFFIILNDIIITFKFVCTEKYISVFKAQTKCD